ncbi:unnamed protein product [Symbiodinium natans]|uniref:Major facilitator superfamily (MFS) profile domain-containing protein n=1 Tax=Symbiodinium natans TaxID=878477 RepID=A0A812VBB4_9DINO|nr:unnamed protein product [Symbiodinium natans]
MATVTCTAEMETCSDLGAHAKDIAPSEATEPLDDKERMPPMTSLVLLYYFLMLGTINVVITIPTANDYAERLGAGRLFAGLMLAALPILSIAGNLFNQWLLTFVPLKHIWIVSTLFTVLGSVLYALAGLMRFRWTLLIARGLMGFFGAFNLPGIYIAHTVGIHRRSEILFYISACLTLGCAVGPALAAMLEESMKFIKVHNLVLDSDTVPGWFMAAVYLLFTAKMVLCFKDLPRSAHTPSQGRTLQSPSSRKSRLSLGRVAAACACFWQLFVTSGITTGVEIFTINVARQTLGWSTARAAWFVALIMLISGVTNLSVGKVMNRVCGDVPGLLIGQLLACFSCVFLFNFDLASPTLHVTLLTIGLVSVLVIQGLARAWAMSICSKIVPADMVNSVMTHAAIFMSLGRGGGSIVCSVLDLDFFAPLLLGLFAVTLAMCFATRKYMKPDLKAC